MFWDFARQPRYNLQSAEGDPPKQSIVFSLRAEAYDSTETPEHSKGAIVLDAFLRALKPSRAKVLFLILIAVPSFISFHWLQEFDIERSIYMTIGSLVWVVGLIVMAGIVFQADVIGEKFSIFGTVFLGFLFTLAGTAIMLIP